MLCHKTQLRQDARFYFDIGAANRIVRFVETFCRHHQGPLQGEPLKLEPVQKRILRDLFGWKWRNIPANGTNAGKRRFTDCYWDAAIGAGKSPILAAVGWFGLVADGEPGAAIYSLASKYSQARIVFDCGKKFREQEKRLARITVAVEREIRHPSSGSVWKITSGKGPGAGQAPTMTLGDEAHDWASPVAYNDLHNRQGKRRQPMTIVATNAPKSEGSFCWKLREQAVAALAGTGSLTLYPIIWKADDKDETLDPEAWKKANPLIGVTIQESAIRLLAEAAVASGDDSEFRREYLGIVPTKGGDRLLDLDLWTACEVDAIKPAQLPAGTPLFVGLDLSQGNDLCAAAFVWPTQERFYVGSRFWMPKEKAEFFYARDGIAYPEWGRDGYVTLLQGPTISTYAQEAIAGEIIRIHAKHPIKAVYYDKAYATHVVATLEAAGIVCVPIQQGWSLSPGYAELDRRLKEGPESIVIARNPVMRHCAENARRKTDERGNFWAVKPHARGNYDGLRIKKIDGITALGTALTPARKFIFPQQSFNPSQAIGIVGASK